MRLINLIDKHAQDVFVSFLVDASVIDREVAAAASRIFCSLEIPFECTEKGGKILFDRKFYANKSKILNDAGIVFGFNITYAVSVGDTLKSFMERLDFAVQQYPNHIDFPQTEVSYSDIKDKYIELIEPKVTGLFSANDIRYCRDVSFACRTFYSNGRAVPWFLSVLKPLRIHPSSFFADFAEWQRCNNCDYKSGFVPENENHKSIERMQLLFLDEKYEETLHYLKSTDADQDFYRILNREMESYQMLSEDALTEAQKILELESLKESDDFRRERRYLDDKLEEAYLRRRIAADDNNKTRE